VQVRDLLQQWAAATRKGQRDDVLANHLTDVFYDVLAPMKYQGAAAYRQSWDDLDILPAIPALSQFAAEHREAPPFALTRPTA
jgi:ketosteroid isomerase-like protein